MHKIQKILLKRLVVQNNQRYSTLTRGYDFEDNIVFHLNQLYNKKLINKSNGIYSITLDGVKMIAGYDPVELEDRGIKTFFVGFLCSDNDNNYLIKSHPNSNSDFYNLPSGKPFFGENINDSLVRLFHLNTGVKLYPEDFQFVSLHLKTIKSSLGEIIFDDAFCIYSIQIEPDQKRSMTLYNGVEWKSVNEIEVLSNKWPEIDICIVQKDLATYKSYIHQSDYILS